jgi:hypothetical protein
MTPRLEDLDPKSQAWIRAQVDKAPELNLHQRAQLEALFRESGDAHE